MVCTDVVFDIEALFVEVEDDDEKLLQLVEVVLELFALLLTFVA